MTQATFTRHDRLEAPVYATDSLHRHVAHVTGSGTILWVAASQLQVGDLVFLGGTLVVRIQYLLGETRDGRLKFGYSDPDNSKLRPGDGLHLDPSGGVLILR